MDEMKCEYCGKSFKKRGLKKHQRACPEAQAARGRELVPKIPANIFVDKERLKIWKSGNSFVVRIPTFYAKRFNLKPGMEILIDLWTIEVMKDD